MMAGKPTNKELVKRVKELEKEALEHKQTAGAFRESEATLRSIFRAVPAGIGLVCDRVIKQANDRLCEILSYSQEELLGKNARMLYLTDEDFKYVGIKKYAQIIEQGAGIAETRLQRKDGKVIDVLLSSAAIDPNDLSVGVTFTVLDITRRKKTEEELRKTRDDLEQRVKEQTAELEASNEKLKQEIIEHEQTEVALRESENRFRTLVESSPVGICIIQQNQIVYQNPILKRLWGPLPKRFENHVLDYLHADDVEKCKKVYRQITSGKKQTSAVDFRFYPPGKKDRKFNLCWVECRASLINYQDEDAILLNMMDITQVKEIEHLLAIQQKMSSLGHVAAGIAHEIRNPLTGINSYLYTLEDLCDSEIIEGDQIEMIKQIISQFHLASGKIEAVIKRVLDFSRPNPPIMDLIDLNQCIEGTLNFSSVTLRQNDIKLKKSLKPDLPKCYGDSHLIEQVFLNLINNAVRAMGKDQKAKRIQIDSFRKKKSLYIQFSDSGPGIPEELKNQIFNPFFTTSPDGTGIGLSIAQRIISDHHGTIEILGNEYGGATFRVGLPIEKRTHSR